MFWGPTFYQDFTGDMVDAFIAANPEIDVELQPSEWDGYWDKLATQVAAGTAPDVMRMSMSYFAEYAERGALLDLTDLVADGIVDVSALDEDVASSGATGSGLFGIGQSSITHATFANTALIDDLGVTLPEQWSWEDFSLFCHEVAEAGEGMYGSTDAGGDLQMFEVWARQHGTDLFGEDGLEVGADVIEEWLAMWQGLRDDRVVPPADITAEAGGFEDSPLSQGTAAAAFGWVQQVTFYDPLIEGSPLRVGAVPGAEAGDLSGQFLKALDLWCVAATSAAPETSAALIDFLLDDERAVTSIGLTLGVPPSESSRSLVEQGQEQDSPAAKAIAYVDAVAGRTGPAPGPWPVGYSELLEAFSRTSESVAFGESDPASAAASLVEEAASMIQPTI